MLAHAAAPLPYAHVAQALDALEATRSRLAKETILLNTFRAALAMKASPLCVEALAYLLAPMKDPQQGGTGSAPSGPTGGRSG